MVVKLMAKRYDAALRVKPLYQKGAQSLGDDEAIQIKNIYPEWEVGVEYTTRKKVQYKGKLYRCLSAHTSQADWTPDVVPSLWTVIDEEHKGTVNDPIPYVNGMELYAGKYYEQYGVVYYCNRDTGIPVHSDLKDLVKLYVEVAANG
jgi:hypothetical protein